MKKIFALLAFLTLFGMAHAQSDFNKWSLEVGAGVNKSMGPLSRGYLSPTLNIGHAEFGARYMFNEKFGLSGSYGFGQFNEVKGTRPFSTNYGNASINGVINWGRILEFQNFAKRFTLLTETGAGAGFLKQESRIRSLLSPSLEPDFDPDYVYSFTGKLRMLYSITEKISLSGTISTTVNGRQRYTFDGNDFIQDGRPLVPEIPFVHATGTWWAGTLGVNFYLGKAQQHADWYLAEDKYATKEDLNTAVNGIKDMLKDSDGDGIADYLDKEANTPAGARVSTNGVTLDSDQDGTPDHLDKCPFLPGPSSTQGCPVEEIKEQVDYLRKAIQDNYVNVYFGFDSYNPLEFSVSAISFVSNFLQKNPAVQIEIKGYADELGGEDYNIKLSEKRAKAVFERMTSAGIDPSRLSFKGYGEDTSVDKSSADARQMARRVSFEVK